MTSHALAGPMAGLNALSCESPAQLHQLVQEVGAVLGVVPASPAVYQAKVDAIASLAMAGTLPALKNSERGSDPEEGGQRTSAAGPSDRAISYDDYSDAEAVIRH